MKEHTETLNILAITDAFLNQKRVLIELSILQYFPFHVVSNIEYHQFTKGEYLSTIVMIKMHNITVTSTTKVTL